MERLVRGDVAVVPFPFSDLTRAKRRPALVLAAPDGNDLILCQITSQAVRDSWALPLSADQFETGGLRKASQVRPNRVFTADRRIVLYQAGRVLPDYLARVVNTLIRILQEDKPSPQAGNRHDEPAG